ncbi:AAA family ATPase [Streptomyces sp. NPDC059629]|uniref:AAA family ATPase n=1 Tax=Streptomyces sp. NPDC059629 TaxID=3346889 RepID=UPI00367B60FC
METKPLRGRRETLARLTGVVREVKQHSSSSVLLISGPAGIGKTTVLSELCAQAAAMSLRVARSKCDEIEQMRPGAAFLALLRSGPEPLLTAGEFARIIRDVDEPLLLADHFEEVAARGPVLIAIDDVQWADAVSRFLLRTLVPRLTGSPVAWVLASRDASSDDFTGHEKVRVMHERLKPLDPSAMAAVARDRLGYPPDAETRRYLASTGGNPLFVAHIIDSVRRAHAQGRATLVTEFEAAVAQQLSDLHRPVRHLVELLALAGRPMPTRDLVALLPGAGSAIPTAMATGLVSATEQGLVMRHDLVGAAVRETLPRKVVRDLHLRFATYYLEEAEDPLAAAAHARVAVEQGDPATVHVLVAAAERLSGLGLSGDDAGDLATLAFRALNPGQPEWLGTSLRCLAVLARTQRVREALAVADVIVANVDDGDLIGRVHAEAARALWLSGRVTELTTRVERVLAGTAPEAVTNSRLHAAYALALTRTDTGEIAAEEAAAAAGQARASGDREALALALQALGEAARNEGRHGIALRYFREQRVVSGSAFLAEEITTLQLLDRYADAQTLLDQARRLGGGHLDTLPGLQSAQMWHDFMLCNLDAAEAGAAAVHELGQQLGTNLYVLDAHVVRTGVALLRDDLETAAAQLAAADKLKGADPAVREPWIAVMSGWLAGRRGDLHASMQTLDPVLRGSRSAFSFWPLWPCWLGMFYEFGGRAETQDFATEVVEAAAHSARRNPGVASFEGIALQLRGLRDNDLDLLARAASVLEASPRPLLRSGGAAAYGRALLAAGHRTEGIAQLDLAWDAFDRLDARTHRASVQRLMRDAGVDRAKWKVMPAEQTSGWAALTPAEKRVAVLISTGHTNKAVASRLGVSINTVGTQARSIFAKLGVQSRVQLANHLHEEGVVGVG